MSEGHPVTRACIPLGPTFGRANVKLGSIRDIQLPVLSPHSITEFIDFIVLVAVGNEVEEKKAPKAKAAEEKPARLSKHHQRMLMPACSTWRISFSKASTEVMIGVGVKKLVILPEGTIDAKKVQATLPAKERGAHCRRATPSRTNS